MKKRYDSFRNCDRQTRRIVMLSMTPITHGHLSLSLTFSASIAHKEAFCGSI